MFTVNIYMLICRDKNCTLLFVCKDTNKTRTNIFCLTHLWNFNHIFLLSTSFLTK